MASEMSVLLLQARRPTDPMAAHEVRCFERTARLAPGALRVHDLCAGPPPLDTVRGHDAVLLGGSGEFYVSKGNLPHFDAFLDLLRELAAGTLPVFASCFGYQSLVQALGGEVISDPERTEAGSFELTTTADTAADPLLGALPGRFWVQMGHRDRISRQPDGVPNLAASELCPLQALRLPGKPIWGVQFHPELDRETNLERFKHYLEQDAGYATPEEAAAQIAAFRESPEASALLPRFLELVAEL